MPTLGVSFELATAEAQTLNFRGRLLDLAHPRVMGILNLTPDSFSDGGQHNTPDAALAHAEAMLKAGADMLDIGAYSTRPGAQDIDNETEWQRIELPLRRIRAAFPDVIITLDTFRARIAQWGVEAGADAINDISGGSLDPELLPTVAELKVPYILTHIQGTPQTMQHNPQYTNVVDEVYAYFTERLNHLANLGIHDVVLDPGFGFGKTIAHNYELMRNLDAFAMLGRPLLAGISRKSMVTKPLGIGWRESLPATTALHLYALQRGARILRVHDVAEAQQTIQLFGLLSETA